MTGKRKDKEVNYDIPAKNKRTKQKKVGNFSDDELSDIDDDGEIFHGIRIPAELPPITSAEENPGPRMVIKNIVINNFKSYYGKVTIGPFHKSLTSIVGANGSGKSNVIDSLLFVFGYRSTKIRSKKVSVLLHKSDKHKVVTQCSVTVNFVLINDDDSQSTGFVPIPGSEITITRTAFEDSSSFYTLNNKRVKFKEVATILNKNGIDLIHNRFLILQGEVEQIAMMKPKAENEHSTGMLEYLEDVIGTVKYKNPIIKLEEKVKVITEEKNEKMTRLKFIAKERDELVDPATAVINYMKMENKCSLIYNKQKQILIYNKQKIIKTKTDELNLIKEKLNSIKLELADIEESKKEKKHLLNKLSKELAVDVKKSINDRKKYDSVVENDAKLVNDNKLLEVQKINYETTLKAEKKKISKTEGVPKLKEAELKHLQSQLAPLEEECIKLEENYEKVNYNGFEKSKKFREEKDKLAPEELELQKLVGSKQNKFQTLKTELEVLLDSEKSEKEKLRKLEEQLIKETEEFQENSRKKQKAESDILNCTDTIKDLEINIQKLKNDEQQMKTNLNNVRQSLNEKKSAYAETTERSRPIQYILKLKDSGEIRGILGRCVSCSDKLYPCGDFQPVVCKLLGDYGRVEDKYDIPACTACGSTDQIVVETSNTAHACIQRLKVNNIGRLTFSILPQVLKLKSRADAIHKYPENSKRVFDLIQILDQRFRLTFYSGLYDTLLAEDLEQARRIAFGTQTRYRVVTYKGDLIDQSGIMSGGGRAIKGKIGPQETTSRYSSGNSFQVSRNEVESLDKICKDLEVKLRQTQSDIFDFQSNIEKNLRQIEEFNVIVKQCSARLNTWKEKENLIKKLIKDQQLVIVKKKTDPIAVANKEAEIKNAEKELEKAQIKYDEIKSKVDTIKKRISEITEGEPREAKRLLDEATNKLEATRIGINQVNVDIQAAERLIKKSESQIEKLIGYIDECNEKIESNNEEIKKNGKLMEEQFTLLDELGKYIDEQKKNIKNITNEEDEYTNRNNELRKNEIQLKQELNNIESIVASHVEKCSRFKLELSELKLHEIPKIDNKQRDPVVESYKSCESQCQNHNTSSLNEDNENESKNTKISPEKDQPNQIQVDDDADITHGSDCKELPQYTDEQLESFNYEKIQYDLVITQEKLKANKPNFSVLEEYKKRNQQYNEKADEVAEISKLHNDHSEMLKKVRQRRKDEFMASFKKITIKLKEIYQMITLGGDADLELCDSLDPFSEGVNFSVRPPKKTWKNISNLSGGEKTLSSLALVFALHYYKPSPLYVMDEIDAALDFKNVSIIAHYIKKRTNNSQFIIISLRANMFEKANVLVGIYKTNDCTETVPINTSAYLHLPAGLLAKNTKKDKFE